MSQARGVGFGIFAATLAIAVAAYVAWRPEMGGAVDRATGEAPASAPNLTLDGIRSGPHVYYRSTRRDEFGRLVVGALGAPNDRRVLTDLTCDRVDAGRDRGVCLVDNRLRIQPPALARVFDRGLQPVHSLDLPGYPSRTRLSRDERLAAATVFVTGEHYTGSFSTRTHIIDLQSGAVLAELEQLAATKDGRPFAKVDFNFWGVTFTDDHNRFYATLATGGKTYLVAGDLVRRQLDVLREDVECPSLSPDQRRLAFKSRLPGGSDWRLHVLDLESMREWPIRGETRSIDDQVEWLDDGHVLYQFAEERGLPEDAVNVWVSPVAPDATETPHIFIRSASSPAVVR
jgi:hypothetical protein